MKHQVEDQSTTSKQLDISQNQKKDQSNSSYSETTEVKFKRMQNNPLTIIKQNKKRKWEITLGNDIVTNKQFKKAWQAKLYIATKPWQIITTIILILIDKQK